MELTNEMRAAAYRELISDDWDSNQAMLTAASKIPLERENGGIEYPPIKVFREMIAAQARVRGVKI